MVDVDGCCLGVAVQGTLEEAAEAFGLRGRSEDLSSGGGVVTLSLILKSLSSSRLLNTNSPSGELSFTCAVSVLTPSPVVAPGVLRGVPSMALRSGLDAVARDHGDTYLEKPPLELGLPRYPPNVAQNSSRIYLPALHVDLSAPAPPRTTVLSVLSLAFDVATQDKSVTH